MQLTKDDFPLRAEGPLIYGRTRSSSILTAWDDELAETIATRLNIQEARRIALEHRTAMGGPLALADAMSVMDAEVVGFGPFAFERASGVGEVISIWRGHERLADVVIPEADAGVPIPMIEGTIHRDPEAGRNVVTVCDDGAASFPEGRG